MLDELDVIADLNAEDHDGPGWPTLEMPPEFGSERCCSLATN